MIIQPQYDVVTLFNSNTYSLAYKKISEDQQIIDIVHADGRIDSFSTNKIGYVQIEQIPTIENDMFSFVLSEEDVLCHYLLSRDGDIIYSSKNTNGSLIAQYSANCNGLIATGKTTDIVKPNGDIIHVDGGCDYLKGNIYGEFFMAFKDDKIAFVDEDGKFITDYR